MNNIKNLTCIVCPIGCQLEVETGGDGKIVNIAGNTCKRGADYAYTEYTDPRRTLTTTVRISGSSADKFLPVRTSSPIQKPKLFEAMELASRLTAVAPVKTGDIVCKDFVEKCIDLIACKTVGDE